VGTTTELLTPVAYMAPAAAGSSDGPSSIMRLFVNSLAARAGGGLTYVHNVIPHLAAVADLQIAVLSAPGIGKEFPAYANVEFMELGLSAARRFRYEQFELAERLRAWRAEILLSTGNFALRNSPVPQILLSRNSIYMAPDFYRDLISRHQYRIWLDTRIRAVLARRSVHWADVTIAPSEAFAVDLRRWSGANNIVAVHHGFDRERFTSDDRPLPAEVENQLRAADGSLKLLFVSHYNYYRNFETLIRALPAIRGSLAGRKLKLLLTCKLAEGENPGPYQPHRAARLVSELGLGETIVELGGIAYRQLHHLYARADIYVTPAYIETFAHPLVEAMACGLPIVASDLPVHREICGDAATYFPAFSSEKLAKCVLQLCHSSETSARSIAAGQQRWRQFSWAVHVQEILKISEQLRHAGGLARTQAGECTGMGA
jgi:glycosyltransferase involved in cell wall biosynthesis